MAIVRGREGGNKRKENRRTRLNDFEEGNEEREISFFAGQRARDATFPVQTTAKKVYLGLFPAACSPAIRIFSLALRRSAIARVSTDTRFIRYSPSISSSCAGKTGEKLGNILKRKRRRRRTFVDGEARETRRKVEARKAK